jgi:hypothetical protein
VLEAGRQVLQLGEQRILSLVAPTGAAQQKGCQQGTRLAAGGWTLLFVASAPLWCLRVAGFELYIELLAATNCWQQ